jgi:hypothetical protein
VVQYDQVPHGGRQDRDRLGRLVATSIQASDIRAMIARAPDETDETAS